MGKPVFASDRSFVSGVCGELIEYFNPLDPADMAKMIFSYFNVDQLERDKRLVAARAYAAEFSSARTRALRYVEILEDALHFSRR